MTLVLCLLSYTLSITRIGTQAPFVKVLQNWAKDSMYKVQSGVWGKRFHPNALPIKGFIGQTSRVDVYKSHTIWTGM